MTQPIHPMLERVADALGNVTDFYGEEFGLKYSKDELRDLARAAIKVLMTPDETMLMCGWAEASQGGHPEECYTAMLRPLVEGEGG